MKIPTHISNPDIGSIVYDQTLEQIRLYTGTGWVNCGVIVLPMPQCILCGFDAENHPIYYNHPHFKDNLSYLAWKYEQRQKV